jgi:hypothetical protein
MTTVEVYDPATDSWSTETDMIIPRHWHANCLLDSSIYVYGGISGSCQDFHSGGELYDPKTDLWREITPNINLSGPCKIASYNGNVYVCGGKVTTCDGLTTYDVKSLFLYESHFDLLPLLDYAFVDKNAVIAGADSVLISTRLYDPSGIKPMAILKDPNGVLIDSIQLYDDGNHGDGAAGDSVYANYWKIESGEEMQYYMDLKVTKIGTDTVVNYFNNRVIISTDELVTSDFDKKDSTCSSIIGDCIWTSLTLQNNSTQYAAKNIKAKLESLDSSVWVFNPILLYDSIPSGSHTTPESIQLMILDDFSDTIPIVVHLHSYDTIFRSDTFSIIVDTATDIINVRPQMVNIYPNPANDILTIETSQPGLHFTEIISLNGQLQYSDRMEGPTHQIDLSSFQKGIYFITIRCKDYIVTEKIIKQ